jgi:hypothetical protein
MTDPVADAARSAAAILAPSLGLGQPTEVNPALAGRRHEDRLAWRCMAGGASHDSRVFEADWPDG